MFDAIIWALFGNDEDGIYGTLKWRLDTFSRAFVYHPRYIALRWWLRNPFHNLLWHVLAWPNDKDPEMWPATTGFKGRLVPPFIAYRGKVDAYIGFRGQQGVFGAAFRVTKSTGA